MSGLSLEMYKDGLKEGRIEGREEGMQQGREEGAIEAFVKIYKNGMIKVGDAARMLNMTVEDFLRIAE